MGLRSVAVAIVARAGHCATITATVGLKESCKSMGLCSKIAITKCELQAQNTKQEEGE